MSNSGVPLQISRLVEDMQRLQSTLSRLREASGAQVHSLEEQLAEKSAAVKVLTERLAAQSDYEEMKRELRLTLTHAHTQEREGEGERGRERGKNRITSRNFLLFPSF